MFFILPLEREIEQDFEIKNVYNDARLQSSIQVLIDEESRKMELVREIVILGQQRGFNFVLVYVEKRWDGSTRMVETVLPLLLSSCALFNETFLSRPFPLI